MDNRDYSPSALTADTRVSVQIILIFNQQKHLILEIEPCDFVRFWPFEPHFLINFFLIKKRLASDIIYSFFNLFCNIFFWYVILELMFVLQLKDGSLITCRKGWKASYMVEFLSPSQI